MNFFGGCHVLVLLSILLLEAGKKNSFCLQIVAQLQQKKQHTCVTTLY